MDRRDTVRNSFPHLRQIQGESAEDFLERLLSDHRRGWHDVTERERNTTVLNVFIHGVTDDRLGESFELEYTKPAYMGNPPTPVELRSYIHRLQNSREIRNNKRNPQKSAQDNRAVYKPNPTALAQQRDALQGYINPSRPNWPAQPSRAQQRQYQERTPTPVTVVGSWGIEPWIALTPIDAHTGWWPKCLPAESPWTPGLLSAHKEACYVKACCGGKKRYQELRQCASQTMEHIEVVKMCLKQLGR